MRVKIHSEGNNILMILIVVLAAINVPLWICLGDSLLAIPIVMTSVSGVFFLLVLNFFRSPKRDFTGERTDAVVASVDGKVVAVEETFEDEYLHQRVIQVSTFMSIFNVHANWFPVDGEVIYTAHHPGNFLAAYLPKASIENERSTVVIRTPDGQLVLVRQIAGAIARRVVTYAAPGDDANIEDHFGFIKFGSRVDIFLPLGSEVFVKIGDKTTGGVSLIGRLKGAGK